MIKKIILFSLKYSMPTISALFVIVSDDCLKDVEMFAKKPEINLILVKLLISIIIFLIVSILYSIYLHTYKKMRINGHNYEISIEYGDIFKYENCKKIVNFDECFTTEIGDNVEKIKPNSVCGQYLTMSRMNNKEIKKLIKRAKLEILDTKSLYKGKTRYKAGLLVPNGDYLLMSFARLDKDGRGLFLSYSEFVDCLTTLWSEIDKYYSQRDVCMPIIGSGLTRIGDKELTQQEILDIIISSYKLSQHKIKKPNKLRIICKKQDDFSLNKIGDFI